MNCELLLDESEAYTRAAIIEDGVLCEIHTEHMGSSANAESIYYGRVVSVRPSIHAAFVDIGEPLHAFLPLEHGLNLKCGDMLIVQCSAKQTTDTKGIRVTAKVNLAGKWLVLVPGSSGVHVSKKVKNQAVCKELIRIGERICPVNCGLIVRTASEGVTEKLLEEEAQMLWETWQQAEQAAKTLMKPGLIHERETLCARLVRDIRNLARIVTNNSESYRKLLQKKEKTLISEETSLELFEENRQLIFDAFGIESQIDKALNKRVWLKCGGYLIMDFCEAMTVIDVNSGKMVLGKDIEDTALRVNLEAADEIARQIRLRDIGGMILVDFIDMMEDSHRRMVLDRMKKAAASDRTKVSIEGFTRLGLMEMTRKRVQMPLHKRMQVSCSYCSSTGCLLSAQEIAMRAIRQVRRMVLSGQRGPFVIHCAPAAAKALADIGWKPFSESVYVQPAAGRHAERFEIRQYGEGMDLPCDAVLMK